MAALGLALSLIGVASYLYALRAEYRSAPESGRTRLAPKLPHVFASAFNLTLATAMFYSSFPWWTYLLLFVALLVGLLFPVLIVRRLRQDHLPDLESLPEAHAQRVPRKSV